jgi:hypothetical protein
VVAIPRVSPDTNVCYPMSLLDLILRCDESSLLTVRRQQSRAPVTILTNNVRDFPARPLAELGVTVMMPDNFFVSMATSHGASLANVIAEMAASRRNPPMTITEVLEALGRAGMPKFAAGIRAAIRAE